MSGSRSIPALVRAGLTAATSRVAAASTAPIRASPLAQPVATQTLPRQSSALAVRPSSELVPHGHKFVPIQDTHRTGMQPATSAQTVIPKGSRLTQTQVSGGPQGEWYSPVLNQTPQQSGISPFGMRRVFEMGPSTPLPPTQLARGQGVMLPGAESWGPARKQTKIYEALTDVPAVSSTAAPIVDTWSIRGVAFPASGGGQQLLSPFRSRFREISSASPALSEQRPTVKTPGDQEE
ncbi:MAG: polymorphic toxin type 46 domain-containing protein [Pseudomonadota bacterium]|nr:polymorphic toxin type 46 domain-containing protein [Pseudomonadota bacterium]